MCRPLSGASARLGEMLIAPYPGTGWDSRITHSVSWAQTVAAHAAALRLRSFRFNPQHDRDGP